MGSSIVQGERRSPSLLKPPGKAGQLLCELELYGLIRENHRRMETKSLS